MGFESSIDSACPPHYRQYYLKYAELKELALELAQDGPAQRSRLNSDALMHLAVLPMGRFQEMLRSELDKVNQFALVKHEALFQGLRRVIDDCKSKVHRLAPSEAALELQRLSKRIEAYSDEIVYLDSFVRLNYIGFQKITQKFDRCLNVSGSALFVAGLYTEPFCNVRFDDILILCSLAWSCWRTAQEGTGNKDKWVPGASFVRNTAKYWVRPDQVVKLKTRIMQHLPYLLFDASEEEQEDTLLDPFAPLNLRDADAGAYTGTMEESQLLSSVYFDSPGAVSYLERIHREEGARLVRFRWYGENNLEADKEIWIERKIHHEGWGGGQQSAKERGKVPQKDVLDFMNGTFDVGRHYAELASEARELNKDPKKQEKQLKSLDSMKGICLEVQGMIKQKELQPIIRTSYYRSAFQLGGNNDVRISLDTQMSLLNEFRPGGHREGPWCHVGTDRLSKSDVYRFPFAILEIKLAGAAVAKPPDWLSETLQEIEAIQVHKFSKFQHAMAFLHPEKVPILPHWHQDFKEWHDQKEVNKLYGNQQKVSYSKMMASYGSMEEVDVPQISATTAPGGHMLKDMQNLDPKGVFANERTLLHYAEKGMYVGALAVVLMYQDDRSSKLAGLLLSLSTGAFYVWALIEYYARAERIVGRSKVSKDRLLRLDWAHGPLVVGVLILAVLAISFCEGLFKGARLSEL